MIRSLNFINSCRYIFSEKYIKNATITSAFRRIEMRGRGVGGGSDREVIEAAVNSRSRVLGDVWIFLELEIKACNGFQE